MDYVSDSGGLSKWRDVDATHRVLFRAGSIRQERTGVHARITLECNGAALAWSTFNVERDEDRGRLANSAYKHLNGVGATYPATLFKNDLDGFCAGLWDAQLLATMPELMAGADQRIGPTFLLRPYVMMGAGTIIFAPPGRGKSYLMLLMCISLDAGLSVLWPCTLSRVLFINLERSRESVKQRVGNCNSALGLERRRSLPTINARGRSLLDVAPAAERFIKDKGIECVMVDSISRAGAGSMVADDSVNRIIDQLNRFDIAWVGLGHTPRSDETHLYGSVMFEAGIDLGVQLLSEQEEGGPLGIGLHVGKRNDIPGQRLWKGALEFDELGLTGVRLGKDGEFPGIESGKHMPPGQQIYQHLLEVGGQSATEIEEVLGIDRVTALRFIAKDGRIQRVGVDARGQGRPHVLYGVVKEGETAEVKKGRGQKSGVDSDGQKSNTKTPDELPF